MKSLLLVDDEDAILEVVKETLELDGEFKILTASNGQQGFEVYSEKKVDAVITDIRMPVQNGIWLVDQIRAKDSEIPIFFMSGFTFEPFEDIKKRNIQGFIRKPQDITKIYDLVSKAL